MRSGRTTLQNIAVWLLLPLLLANSGAWARAEAEMAASGREERGLPFLRNYAPKEYAAHSQNWAMVQDQRGMIYAANSYGVLEFDGLRWRLIRTAKKTTVRSLAVGADGRVYVGALGEIGYLAADADGNAQYVSLLDRIPAEARAFDDVHHIFVTAKGIYFATYARLIRLDGDEVRVWNPASAFHRAFLVGDQLYIRERDRGLLRLDADDQLTLVPGGGRFAEERVDAIIAWPGKHTDSVLIGSRGQGLLVLDGDALTAFPTSVDAELERDLVYGAVRLPDGGVAVGTIQGGVYFLDVRGQMLGRLDKRTGLQDNTVYAMMVDREGGLWLGLDRGLTRVAVGAMSQFDERLGLDGVALSMRRHQGQLYAGTAQGLFRLRAGPKPQFEAITGIKGQTYDLLPWGDTLLVANNEGTYALRGDTAELIQRGRTATAMALLASQAHPGRVYVALWDGLASLRFESGQWIDEGRIAGVSEDVSSLVEDDDGQLWAGSSAKDVLRVRFERNAVDAGPGRAHIDRFNTAQGLPSVGDLFVQRIGDDVMCATHQGLYRFDTDSNRFEADPRFADLFTDGKRWVVYGTAVDTRQRIWMQSADEVAGHFEAGVVVPAADGRYRWDPSPLRPISGAWIEKIFADDDGIVWFGSAEGLYRFDPAVAVRHDQSFSAMVRQVSAPGGGNVHFGGSGDVAPAQFAFADNGLRFEYAAPSFVNADATQFQVLLQGFDPGWTAWTAEGFREYTNLREGQYRFRVRARNLHGTISDEASYAFQVIPPWFRTWPAYLAYVVGAGFLLWMLLLWRTRVVAAENHALELTIAARTAELREKNLQLEEARKLAEAREQEAQAQHLAAVTLREHAEEANRSKSVFLANMSHELRTPLNGVLGFAQLMERTPDRSPEDRKHLGTILRSGEHLLGLINDVLSLSKIEAGGMVLTEAPFELEALLHGVCDLVRVRAEARDLWLRTQWQDLPRMVHGDAQKLSQILLNLLGNAVKFTVRGGVTLRARWANDRAVFEIEDTGAGIAADEITQLFAPFVQSASGRESREGTGLGLTLSRQIARLMDGDVHIRSELGRGTTLHVDVRLPVSAATVSADGHDSMRRVRAIAPGQSSIRVLVVDDVADNRTLLAGLLQAVGFDVQQAADGPEALRVWRVWQPHLIWMDKRMPGMDGTEAARRIRAEEKFGERPRVAILALSASALEHERAEILASGCDDFVPKPFRESLIFAKMSEFTGVIFSFDDKVDEPLAVTLDGGSLRIEHLPVAWLAGIRHALAIGDTERARQLADDIEPTDSALAAHLRSMLTAYRLDELEQLFAADRSA